MSVEILHIQVAERIKFVMPKLRKVMLFELSYGHVCYFIKYFMGFRFGKVVVAAVRSQGERNYFDQLVYERPFAPIEGNIVYRNTTLKWLVLIVILTLG